MSDIFAHRGEAEFRAVEAEVIGEALETFAGVLALGGGAVTTPAVRDALRSSGVTVVHLATTLASALARIGDGSSRPLLRDDPAGRLAILAQERTPLYEAVCTVEVRSAGRPIFMIVDDLVAVGEQSLSKRSDA